MRTVKMFSVKELGVSDETNWKLCQLSGGPSECCYTWIYVDPEEYEDMPDLYEGLIKAGAKNGEEVLIDCCW